MEGRGYCGQRFEVALEERRIRCHQTSWLLRLKLSCFLVNRSHGVKQMASGGGTGVGVPSGLSQAKPSGPHRPESKTLAQALELST